MLNIDKYRKEIDLIIEKGAMPRHGILRMCLEETNSESVDAAAAMDWLFSEYEPPLLKNGDDLKPGDWIMVSFDRTAFIKRQFLFFHDGMFYTTVNDEVFRCSGTYTNWEYARLPMEGE